MPGAQCGIPPPSSSQAAAGPCDPASPPGPRRPERRGPEPGSWALSGGPGRLGTRLPREAAGGSRLSEELLGPHSPFLLSPICDSPSRPKCAADSLSPGLGPPWHLLASMVPGGHRGRTRGQGASGPWGVKGPATCAHSLHPSFLGCVTFFFF